MSTGTGFYLREYMTGCDVRVVPIDAVDLEQARAILLDQVNKLQKHGWAYCMGPDASSFRLTCDELELVLDMSVVQDG